MSNIRLQGNPSGTGTLTIASPNTNSDFTLNLPASNGTIPVLASVTNNGVVFVNGSGQATSGSALTFDGTVLTNTRNTTDGSAAALTLNNSGATASYATLSLNAGTVAYQQFSDAAGNAIGTAGVMCRTTSNHPLLWGTNNTERMRLDSSGNLGLGVTPSAWAAFPAIQFAQGVSVSQGGFGVNTYFNSGFKYVASGAATLYQPASGAHIWYNAPSGTAGNAISFTQAMTLDSNGNLLVGATSQPAFANARLLVSRGVADYSISAVNSGADPYGLIVGFTAATPNSSGNAFIYCLDGGSNQRFSVRSNGGVFNYSGNNVNLSDRREKTNFAPAGEYLSKICAIPVQTFNYIDQNMEEDPGLTLGVVAQDVQAVAPELVLESNWGTQEEPKQRLSIYQTDLQYALMKAIQELNAKLEAQAAEIAALKGTA